MMKIIYFTIESLENTVKHKEGNKNYFFLSLPRDNAIIDICHFNYIFIQ